MTHLAASRNPISTVVSGASNPGSVPLFLKYLLKMCPVLQQWAEKDPVLVHNLSIAELTRCRPLSCNNLDDMKRRLRWVLLAIAAISLAFGQTEEQYRRFIDHIQNALA